MLCVGRQAKRDDPEIAVQHVTALDDRIRAELGVSRSASLDLDRRLEPAAESEIVDALAHPPDDVVRPCHAGRDHRIREGGVDDCPHQLLHPLVKRRLVGQSRGDEIQRQAIVAHEAARPLVAERLAHSFHLAGAEAVTESEYTRHVDGDRSRVALLDHLL